MPISFFSSIYAIPVETARHLVFMTTHIEQPSRLASLFMQSFLQAFFKFPTAWVAQFIIFHASSMLRSISSMVSPPQTHRPRRQTQESAHWVLQAGITGMLDMSPF